MVSIARTDLILSRFPGPVTLYPSRMKWLLLLLLSCAFTAGGYWMVLKQADWGWFVLIFFAVCTIVTAVMLLPGAGSLVLNAEGFQITGLFRRTRARWQDVSPFQPASISYKGQEFRFVGFDNTIVTGNTLARLNNAIAGCNSALPDTYGFSVDDLAWLMTEWRKRVLT